MIATQTWLSAMGANEDTELVDINQTTPDLELDWE